MATASDKSPPNRVQEQLKSLIDEDPDLAKVFLELEKILRWYRRSKQGKAPDLANRLRNNRYLLRNVIGCDERIVEEFAPKKISDWPLAYQKVARKFRKEATRKCRERKRQEDQV